MKARAEGFKRELSRMKKLMDSRMIKKVPESSISKNPAPLPNIPSDMVFSSTKPSRRFPLGRDSGSPARIITKVSAQKA